MSKNRYLSIALSALLVIWIIRFATDHSPQSGGIKGHTVPATQGPSALVRALRPNYPYSVIAGGAYTQSELQFAHGKDNLVRSHYADFDVKHAKLVNLTEDRYQYVSYRLKDQIYWTKRKLRIPKGELLLTDGVHYARTRCGNRLSETPHQAASSPNEPDPKALSLPSVTPDMLPRMALATPPSLGVIPPLEPLVSSHTGAGVAPVQPTLPVIQPGIGNETTLTGFAPASPGLPVLTTGGGGLPPTTPPATTPQPPTGSNPRPPSTPPVGPPTPPVDVLPVPEPSTLYLFAVSLVLIVFALLRLGPREESEGNKMGTDRHSR